MKWLVVSSVFVAAMTWTAVADGPRVGLTAVRAMEQSFDKSVVTASPESPFDLLGTTRGVYLDGYGAVFTAEVNLMVTTNITPFLQKIPKDYVVKFLAFRLHDDLRGKAGSVLPLGEVDQRNAQHDVFFWTHAIE